ncbi:MAG: response regulator [Thermodesulfovibrionales bacterium]|nr:response regulator [Thermodesulfovibrionales bacterium]
MKTILIADDNQDNLYLLQSMLASSGHTVIMATNGAEALEKARKSLPDLIISDILMPVMDGFSLCNAWEKDPILQDIPFVFYTGTYTDPKDEQFALSLGADRFIVKPKEPEVFLKIIADLLAGPRREKGEKRHRLKMPEKVLMREYSESLFRKLENKMLELEAANRLLKEKELALGNSIRNWQITFDAMNDAISLIGLDGKILRCNTAMAKLVGRQIKDVIGQNCYTLMHGASKPIPECPIVRIKSSKQREFLELFKNDRWLHVTVDPLLDDESSLIGGIHIIRDITERKRVEEELRRHREHLEELVGERTAELEDMNKELESFSYSVSHDLRAPLRHLTGFAGLLTEKLSENLDDEGKRYLQVISDSAMKMSRLIDDILLFSRMGRAEMRKISIDMNALVKEALQELETEVQGRDIRWAIGELPRVEGDPTMLRLVMINLIANALKFTRKKKQGIIEINAAAKKKEVVLTVKDNGVGFDMKYGDKLFSIFQRLHREEDFEGTGIGLAHVKRLVHRHGGRVWADGKVNEGASFSFSLPKS